MFPVHPNDLPLLDDSYILWNMMFWRGYVKLPKGNSTYLPQFSGWFNPYKWKMRISTSSYQT